jgi:membrane protease YdiL (CAAX protease family)
LVKYFLTMLGIGASLVAGAWAYWKIRGKELPDVWRETRARILAGLATTVVSAAVFIALDVHKYFGNEIPWTFSIFLAVCAGICEGVLYRGRALERFHPNAKMPPPSDLELSRADDE